MKRLDIVKHGTRAGFRKGKVSQYYEVMPYDVGDSRQNYLDYGLPARAITAADVGRRVEVLSDPNNASWTCWFFI